MPNQPGMPKHTKAWWAQYEALRREGYSKATSARITNDSQKDQRRKRGKK